MPQRRFRRRPLGELLEKRGDAFGEPAKHGVRERHGTLQPRAADELDGLVDCRVPGDALDEAELVGAESQRSSHRRVEPVHSPAPEPLDRVVERACALHGAVCETLRERTVTVVETGHGGAQCSIRVCAFLEHANEDGVRRRARRAYGRRPRSHASYVIRRPPSGCTSTGSNRPSAGDSRFPDRDPPPVEIRAGSDVR